MPIQVIAAATDTSAYTGDHWYAKQNKPGRNTEIWHIPHEMEPNKPLCNARLSGKFKRTKGAPNCSSCRANASLRGFDHRYHGVLLALDAGLPMPAPAERWHTNDALYEGDLIADVRGKVVLTTRGKSLVADLKDPIGVLSQSSNVFHGRWPLRHETRCGILIVGSEMPLYEALEELRAKAKKHGRRTITCIACIVRPNPYRNDSEP